MNRFLSASWKRRRRRRHTSSVGNGNCNCNGGCSSRDLWLGMIRIVAASFALAMVASYSALLLFPHLLSVLLPQQIEQGGLSREEISSPLIAPPSRDIDETSLGISGELWRHKLWEPPQDQGFEPCVSPGESYHGIKMSRGYLFVYANGGLNQMRTGICDMVAVAFLINATLVIPELDKKSYWQDSSVFSDVFDEEYFIKALKNDVHIVKQLPEELRSAQRARKHFRSWSGSQYYEQEITQLWNEYKVIHAVKADSRLSNNYLPREIQKLRCRVQYDALRFAPAIESLGKRLVERMRSNGPFIALHLRYEKDMLAFSGCTHGLSDAEIQELATIRNNTPHWRVKLIDSKMQRAEGLCPLTPKEVGIFLKALGYPSGINIYIAAGNIYGNNSLMDLQAHYPNLKSKETIATRQELEPFNRHASQMAALDYIVSVESDVFLPSYTGNMARAVEGHRRFLGHRKTIIPDRKQLVQLFDQLDEGILREGPEFSMAVTEMHRNRLGAPRERKGPEPNSRGKDRLRTEESFYTNPLPECICQKQNYHQQGII